VSFAYIPTSGIKTNIVHLKSFIWLLGLILKFEKDFRRDERPQRYRRIKRSEVG